MSERLTHDAEGMLDEIVAHGVDFHLERMDDATLFLHLTRDGEDVLRGTVYAKRYRLAAYVIISETTLPRGGA